MFFFFFFSKEQFRIKLMVLLTMSGFDQEKKRELRVEREMHALVPMNAIDSVMNIIGSAMYSIQAVLSIGN